MITYRVEVRDNGDISWYLNDQLHREDGPAIEYADGTKVWYIRDQRHREDGPAIERSDGTKAWYIHGKEYTEKKFNERLSPTKELTVAEVEKLLGHKVKIIKG